MRWWSPTVVEWTISLQAADGEDNSFKCSHVKKILPANRKLAQQDERRDSLSGHSKLASTSQTLGPSDSVLSIGSQGIGSRHCLSWLCLEIPGIENLSDMLVFCLQGDFFLTWGNCNPSCLFSLFLYLKMSPLYSHLILLNLSSLNLANILTLPENNKHTTVNSNDRTVVLGETGQPGWSVLWRRTVEGGLIHFRLFHGWRDSWGRVGEVSLLGHTGKGYLIS